MRPRLLWFLPCLLACSDVPTTQTGVPIPPPPGGPNLPTVTYQVVLLHADTAVVAGDVILTQHVSVRTRDGRAVRAAEVDFGATEGSVQPSTMTMAPDGTALVVWTIPPSVLVANLLACARPPLGSCLRGPILKWNR